MEKKRLYFQRYLPNLNGIKQNVKHPEGCTHLSPSKYPWIILPSDKCHGTLLMIPNIGAGNAFGAVMHYLNQCWLRSLSPSGVTRPQWVVLFLSSPPLSYQQLQLPWWRHQMETHSALLALCAGNSPVTGEFPSQRPVTRSFVVFFDLHLNKRLSKQSRRLWFETPSSSLWLHCNAVYLPKPIQSQ